MAWSTAATSAATGRASGKFATAPRPAFEVREAGGVIQVCLPGAG